MEKITNVFEYNDEQDENAELAKKSSIHGSVFELLYMDEDSNIRFSKVPANQGILIKDTNPPKDGYLGFIRSLHYLDKNKQMHILMEFYTLRRYGTSKEKEKARFSLFRLWIITGRTFL